MARHDRRLTRPLARGDRALRALVAALLAVAALGLAVPLAGPAAAQTAPGTGALEVHLSECPPGYDGQDPYGACHANGLQGIDVTIAGPTSATQATAGGTGLTRFADIPAGTYTVTAALPDSGQAYRTWCSVEGDGARLPMSPENSNGGAVPVGEGQVVICDLYVVPPAAPAGDQPGGQPAAPAAPAEGTARVTINPEACPVGTDPGAGYDALAAACSGPVPGVTFTWADASGTLATIDTDDDDPANGENGQVVIDGIAPGSYTLYSDIPLSAATEVAWCVADGGSRYQRTFNEVGVTAFDGIQREQITCDWFIVPIDNEQDPTDQPVVTPTPGADGGRGVESGASLVVHLVACPVEYDGDDLYDTCHGEGIADQEFRLTGPGGESSGMTVVPQSPGPGIVEFTGLPAGDYTLMGGPPGDFGSVRLYCTTQPDGARIDAAVDGVVATFALGDGEDVLCDWYYIPEDARGEAPTPTVVPEPTRAEIVVTLRACPPGETMAGAGYDAFTDACGETRDGVTFTLGDPAAPPLSANTGVSGPGAVRFYDLLPADYTLTPALPGGLASAAVWCRIDGGDAYQKSLSGGGTTFVGVDGEAIACDWFVTQAGAPQPQGPSGAITVREFLCEKDAAEISDWERECAPGTTGVTFELASIDGALALSAPADASGIAAFTSLPDGFYTLKQAEGAWCKAKAERVDSQSRVIVEGGQNTNVYIYQCSQVTHLPSTGTGSGIAPMDGAGGAWWAAVSPVQAALMGVGVIGAAVLLAWALTRRHAA